MASDLNPFPLLPPNGGMVLSGPEGQVPPGAARYIVDGLIDRAGEIRQRGPIKNAGSFPELNDSLPVVFASTRTARSELRYLIGYGSGNVIVFDSNGNSLGVVATGVSPLSDSIFLDAKPNLAGGVFLSMVGPDISGFPNRKMSRAEWRGGYGADTGPGGAGKRLTNLPTAAADTVNFAGGTALTTAHIGCFLWSGALSTTLLPIGWIYDVPSATSARIASPMYRALGTAALTDAYVISPLHMHQPLIMGQGTISTLTTSAVVTGANTKFFQATGSGAAGTYYVHRQRDSAYVGIVASWQSDYALSLGANATVKMDNEQYYIVNPRALDLGGWGYLSNGLTISPEFRDYRDLPGAWTAVYAGRQWDAVRIHPAGGREDRNTVWYSEKNRMLITDRCVGSGQYVVVGDANSMHDEIQNIEGTPGGLVVWKKGSTFVIPQKNPPFSPQLLVTDGMLNPNAYTRFGDGVVWAGFKGVWYFDGSSVQNIVQDSLGAEYPRMISNLLTNGDGIIVDNAYPALVTHGDHVWVNLKGTAPNMGLYIRRP